MSFKPERNYRRLAQDDPNHLECKHCNIPFNRDLAPLFLLHLACLDGHGMDACNRVPLIILAKARLELQGVNIGEIALNINAPINFLFIQPMNPAEHFCWNKCRIDHPEENLTFHLSSFVTLMGDDGNMGLASKRGMHSQFQHMRSSNWKPIMHLGNLEGTLAYPNPQVINLIEVTKDIQNQCFETSNQMERVMDTLYTNPTLGMAQYNALIQGLQNLQATIETSLNEAKQACEVVSLIGVIGVNNVDG